MEKYFLLFTYPGGTYMDECETYQQACQIIIEQANYEVVEESETDFVEIIRGRVIGTV